MQAEVTSCREYGTDRPCDIGRVEYVEGFCEHVILAFRYTDDGSDWFLTWAGAKGSDAARMPKGIAPSTEMLAALEVAA